MSQMCLESEAPQVSTAKVPQGLLEGWSLDLKGLVRYLRWLLVRVTNYHCLLTARWRLPCLIYSINVNDLSVCLTTFLVSSTPETWQNDVVDSDNCQLVHAVSL